MMMLVFVLGTAVAFSSCTKDEDYNNGNNGSSNNNTSSNPIVGVWYCEDNPQVGGFCFNADGTGYAFFDGKEKKDEFTYELKGGMIYFGGSKYDGRSLQYSVGGNKLTISMNGMSLTYKKR